MAERHQTRRISRGINPPAGGIADGVPEVLRAVRQQIAAGAELDQDVRFDRNG